MTVQILAFTSLASLGPVCAFAQTGPSEVRLSLYTLLSKTNSPHQYVQSIIAYLLFPTSSQLGIQTYVIVRTYAPCTCTIRIKLVGGVGGNISI